MKLTKLAAIMASVNSALALLLAFGVELSSVQTSAITVFVNAMLVLGAVIRDPEVPFGAVPADEPEDPRANDGIVGR